MESVVDLYQQVRSKFPGIAASADAYHEKRWGDTLGVGVEYAWFEALADALNEEMRREVPYLIHKRLFELLAGAWGASPEPVRQCIDVAFVENLFWNVPSAKCQSYWEQLPSPLNRLYMEFHHRAP